MTHTQRTLKLLRDQGYTAGVVERWVPNPKHPAGGVRKDLFGFIDIIAIKGDFTCAIQSCGQDFAAHDRKILAEPATLVWSRGAGRIVILIGWRKVKKKRGGKAMVWKPRIKNYTLEDFKGEPDNMKADDERGF